MSSCLSVILGHLDHEACCVVGAGPGRHCDCARRGWAIQIRRWAEEADTTRIDWLEAQAEPHHGVIVCSLNIPNEPRWASVQRVNQFYNPHKVEWCHEGATLRAAIDAARSPTTGKADAP